MHYRMRIEPESGSNEFYGKVDSSTQLHIWRFGSKLTRIQLPWASSYCNAGELIVTKPVDFISHGLGTAAVHGPIRGLSISIVDAVRESYQMWGVRLEHAAIEQFQRFYDDDDGASERLELSFARAVHFQAGYEDQDVTGRLRVLLNL
jgi:hypothetical protein